MADPSKPFATPEALVQPEGLPETEDDMGVCQRCTIPNPDDLEVFNRLRGIVGGASWLRDALVADINIWFPGLVETILTPSGPFDLLGMTNVNQLGTKRRIFLEAVEAPLDFDAAHKLLECKECGSGSSVVVFGASFLALCRNVLATSRGQGLSHADLKIFVRELWDDPRRLRRPPPALLPYDPITFGVAWMAAHEFGHAFAKSDNVTAEWLNVPAWCKAAVLDELWADQMSFNFLSNRISATPWLGARVPRLLDLYDGVEMIMRGSSLLHSIRRRKHLPFDQWPDVFPDGSPTPTLRWKSIKSTFDVNLTLYSSEREVGFFDKWDSTAEGMLQ